MQVEWTVIPPNVLVKLHKSPAVTKFHISSLKFVIIGGSVLNEDTEKSVMKRFPDSQIYHVHGGNIKFRKYQTLKIYLFLGFFILFNWPPNLKLGILCLF